jgi:haloacetate dehalogenase
MDASLDLFPGFDTFDVTVDGTTFHGRIGGPVDGPPVVLLHGFPQTHACWHLVAPGLAQRHRVVCLDLKGYGASDAPPGDPAHEAYSKRTMGREVVAVMAELGHPTFSVVGHDRGALVGYRMALDSPERVRSLAILDNYPTFVIWEYMAQDAGFTPHWRTYAQEDASAERSMSWEGLMQLVAVHTATGTADPIDSRALAAYQETWTQPDRIHAFCEDYRAGATVDPALDRADMAARRTVDCPTLVLWGEKFLGQAAERADDIWRRTFVPHAEGVEVPGGHFNAEESPAETTAALLAFLDRVGDGEA